MTKFVDLDFGNLIAILEENGYDASNADDYELVSYSEENNVATYKLINAPGSFLRTFMFTLRRANDQFTVGVN